MYTYIYNKYRFVFWLLGITHQLSPNRLTYENRLIEHVQVQIQIQRELSLANKSSILLVDQNMLCLNNYTPITNFHLYLLRQRNCAFRPST